MTLFQVSMNKCSGFADDADQNGADGFHIILRVWRLQFEWWFMWIGKR